MQLAHDMAAFIGSIRKVLTGGTLTTANDLVGRYHKSQTTDDIKREAAERYVDGSDGNIEIDSDAFASGAENGTWVQAWVWVPEEETDASL